MFQDNTGVDASSKDIAQSNNTDVISGVIEHVRYHRADTGYTIARVKLQGSDESRTNVVAFIPSPRIGDLYQFKGSWVEHPQYGVQFQVEEFEAKPPVTEEGIRAYLASEIDEIGPEFAKRIVETFGMDTLTIMDQHPHRLKEVSGIGKKRSEAILNAWRDNKNLRETFVFLYSQGIRAGLASKVFKRYGSATIDVVRQNPYRLALEIVGVGFMTADRIAEKAGIARDSSERICGGMIYVLETAASNGHTYLPLRVLLHESEKLLNIDKQEISQNVPVIESMNYVYMEKASGVPPEQDAVYLSSLYHAEKQAALDLIDLNRAQKNVSGMDPNRAIHWMEDNFHMQLSHQQKEALICSATNTCMVLTGGPGTGKTYTLTAIIHMYQLIHARIVLCAPTGRAAKRMTEATGRQASTIHRLLEFNPMKGAFHRSENNPIEADLIIVDEFSMVDIILLQHLLSAVTPGATLVCVGDVDQLPSVGPGNCLKDIIASGLVPVVRLDTIFRQGMASRIIVNSHLINHGKMPVIIEDDNSDYLFVSEDDPEKILNEILRQVTIELPKKYGLDPISDVQVLSPMHKGVLGVENLNRQLQQALNPSGKTFHRGTMEFRVGDKVMQTRNNYELEVFNGDIGYLVDFNEKNGSLMVRYDDCVVQYSSADADDLVIAYATTIHKAQGSEYDAVVLPVHTQHYVMLARNLLYTAVSRGKKLVLTIGSLRAVRLSVENNQSRKRFAKFAHRLAADPF